MKFNAQDTYCSWNVSGVYQNFLLLNIIQQINVNTQSKGYLSLFLWKHIVYFIQMAKSLGYNDNR